MRKILLAMLFTALLLGCSNDTSESEAIDRDVKENDISMKLEDVEGNEDIEDSQIIMTEEETSYLSTMGEVFAIFDTVMGDIHTSISEVNKNPLLLESQQWIDTLEANFAVFDTMGGLLRGMEEEGKVPSKFADIHKPIHEAVKLMQSAGDNIVGGIKDDMNEDMLVKGADLMNLSTEKVNEANDVIKSHTGRLNSEKID